MSRHTIPHQTHTIVVGYDSPMSTFFAQVICPKADPQDELEDDVFAVEIGLRPGEVQDVHLFKNMLETEALNAGVEVFLDHHMQARLLLDQSEATGPTELQRRGLALAAEFEKRRDRK